MKKKTPKPTLGQLYQQALDKRERAESKLIRAHNAWVAAGRAVKRMEKRLDKEQAEKHNEIGGKVDIRDIAPTLAATPPAVIAASKKAKKSGASA